MALGIDPQSLFRHFIPTRTARHATKSRKNPSRAALRFECLEPRQMLAADMAEIVGTIRLDAQNDSNPANDTLVAGAIVKLYRDGGDGVFNNGGGDDVTAAANATSNSLGQYSFTGLGAGKYFVKVDLPAGMQAGAGGDVKTITISADDADGAIGRMIDEFDSYQAVEASPPPNSAGVGSTRTDPTVLGGERDFRVEITAGSDQFSSVSLISAGGVLRLASGAMLTANATIVWDGIDGDANAINYTGLGGLDFTVDGPNRMTGIRQSVGADHPNSIVKLRIYTDATHWSEFTNTVPQSVGGAIDTQVVFDFSTPSSTGGGGADFTNVGAIEVTFVGVSAVDALISVAELVGVTTKTADFAALSQLSVGDRVWADTNNNGLLDGAEAGIAGVKMNLYADTDGNNQYTPGTDTFVATTTTDSTGRYAFNGLVPGSYVVQVDAMNFNTGQALAGLQSSTGKTVTDPDDNVDNDNNGRALAGHGVVAMAVSLAANAEPTSDGDDANSNRTVDFGFFGFDLVLDKSVDQTATSPLEELTYSVLITNDGPAIAKNVRFEDNLPDGVTFKSASVSKAGLSVSHSSGKVTGSFGAMTPGESFIVTIKVTVKATATGILVNKADVIADDEINLTNNHDEVETPVTPKIDLQITKSAPAVVAPGAQFNYILEVKNNGPSAATGVTVIDTLPHHVSYVSSTRTNVGLLPGELEFDLGNMAVGATTTITIVVQVDPSYVGNLHNETIVSGNEVEITYVNNEDDADTLVQADPASIGGHVYNDKNNNGVKEAGEKPIANVVITLTGNDLTGQFVSRTTTTDALGRYQFNNLQPGTYMVFQPSQPPKYKDGIDSLGDTFNGQGVKQAPNGLLAPDQNADDDRDGEAFEDIVLNSGYAAKDYNFGELAVTTNKSDFVRPLAWR